MQGFSTLKNKPRIDMRGLFMFLVWEDDRYCFPPSAA